MGKSLGYHVTLNKFTAISVDQRGLKCGGPFRKKIAGFLSCVEPGTLTSEEGHRKIPQRNDQLDEVGYDHFRELAYPTDGAIYNARRLHSSCKERIHTISYSFKACGQ